MITPHPDQTEAIKAPHDRPVRIVAGAGTGKTEVVSRRFVHLLVHAGLRPEQILVLTFSEKAAAEMRARIFRAVAGAGLGYRRLDLAGAFISTFHSFGARLLRDHSLFAGIDGALPFLTEADTEEMLNRAVTAFLEREYAEAYSFDPLEKDVYTWEDGGPVRTAMAIIDQLRNQAVGVEAFDAAWRALESPSDRQAVMAPLVSRLYRAYQAMLGQRGQLDFDRLIMGTVELLERYPDVQARVRHAWRAILVDEYQDTNHAQERLLRAVAQEGMRNVTVVGDPRQAIYVWREARVENIAGFPGDGGVRIEAPLSRNWRSIAPILAVANRAIQGYEFGDPPEFDAGRLLETGRPAAQPGGPGVTLATFASREAEAEGVAEWIARLRAEGRACRDMAVLIRARTYLEVYLEALRRAGVPFEVSAGDAFYTRPEIMHALHILRVCVNPMDTLAVAVTLLGPAVGLSQAEVARLAQSDDAPLWDVVSTYRAETGEARIARRLEGFTAFWAEAQRQRWLRSPSSFVAWALQASGLEGYIAGLSDPGAGRALHKLLAVAHVYEAEYPGDTLEDMVEHLRRLVRTEPREKTPELTGDADAVAVLTAHASKGLEFPVVIAVDNRQRLTPSQRKTPFHEPGVGLVFPEEDEGNPHALTRMRHLRNEARCLWYVTLTRARERLVVTAPDAAHLEPGGIYSPARTFFQELWNRETVQPSPGVERVILGSGSEMG
jgi:DNA helicase-2/ATP-dependent DNA helicase PcrA